MTFHPVLLWARATYVEIRNQNKSPLMTTDNFHGIDRLVARSLSPMKSVSWACHLLMCRDVTSPMEYRNRKVALSEPVSPLGPARSASFPAPPDSRTAPSPRRRASWDAAGEIHGDYLFDCNYRRSVKTVGNPEGPAAPSLSLPFIEGTVRVLPSAAKQRPNLVAPLAHTTRALWRDRAERRSHGAAE